MMFGSCQVRDSTIEQEIKKYQVVCFALCEQHNALPCLVLESGICQRFGRFKGLIEKHYGCQISNTYVLRRIK
jgi:hypothetical protein